ncbi:MAG: hypothetical protein LBB89_03315 [Treponema sp.]|jgi:hypothetical protein|nr:hypothetical protein [Treponema sp.]
MVKYIVAENIIKEVVYEKTGKKTRIKRAIKMNQTIRVHRGNVVGIGRIKIPKTQEFDYEIQLLSYLDIQESEASFIATCIHLHIDGYGKTIEEAEEDMVENIYYFLCENFNQLSLEDAWDNLRDLFKSDDWSNELWGAYHEVQIRLSMRGESTDNTASLLKRLNQLARRVKELEAKVRDSEETEVRIIAFEIRNLAKDLIVDNTRLGEVA